MDTLWQNVPTAAAVIVICGLFLKFMRDLVMEHRSQMRAQHESQIAQISQLVSSSAQQAADCHDVQMKATEATNRNTEALGEMRGTLQQVASVIERNGH